MYDNHGIQIKEGKVKHMSEQIKLNPARKRPKKKRRILRKLLLLLIVLAVIAGGALYAYESLRQKYTITYTSYTATTGSISNALSFSGSMSLIDNTTYTAPTDGTIRAVYVAVGDQVKTGDKLIRLSTGDTITADFDGRVNALKVEEGDKVSGGDDTSAGTALIQVADFDHMKVSIRVDEYDIADVSLGQRCTVTATATEKTFQSTIEEIDYISSSTGNVAYYTATAYVQVEEGVYPGMQVTISIPQEEAKDVVILKMDALSFDETNSAFVYMYNDAGILTEVPVTVGVSNGNYVEIKSSLKSGDTVYVQTETETASGIESMLSGIFGGQQMMPGAGGTQRNNRNNTERNTERQNFNMPGGSSNMPSGGYGGGRQ